ncbi:hypothetical protein D3C87_1940570 [compost metagenome]
MIIGVRLVGSNSVGIDADGCSTRKETFQAQQFHGSDLEAYEQMKRGLVTRYDHTPRGHLRRNSISRAFHQTK